MARQRLAYLQRLRQAHCAGKRMSNRNVASMYRQGLELRDDYQHFLFQHGILPSFEGSRDSFRWARVLFESRGGAGSSEKVSVRIVHPARSFGDQSESLPTEKHLLQLGAQAYLCARYTCTAPPGRPRSQLGA